MGLSVSLNRYNPARDANEPEIVGELRARGCIVAPLSGSAVPDLLVGHAGRWILLEVKTGAGKLTGAQARWHKHARGAGLPVHVVRTPEQALDALEINVCRSTPNR